MKLKITAVVLAFVLGSSSAQAVGIASWAQEAAATRTFPSGNDNQGGVAAPAGE